MSERQTPSRQEDPRAQSLPALMRGVVNTREMRVITAWFMASAILQGMTLALMIPFLRALYGRWETVGAWTASRAAWAAAAFAAAASAAACAASALRRAISAESVMAPS